MENPDLHSTRASATSRHASLFELIRRKNIAARPVDTAPAAKSDTAQTPRTCLLPQEQQALGITASFGR